MSTDDSRAVQILGKDSHLQGSSDHSVIEVQDAKQVLDRAFPCHSESDTPRDAGDEDSGDSTRSMGASSPFQVTPLRLSGNSNQVYKMQTPRASIGRGLKDNPFVKADQTARALGFTPKTAPFRSQAVKPRRLSDCVPRRLMDRPAAYTRRHEKQDIISSSSIVDDAEEHAVCCAARKSLTIQPGDGRDSQQNLDNKIGGYGDRELQRKIDRLRERAESFHSSHHVQPQIATATAHFIDISSKTQTKTRHETPARHQGPHLLQHDDRFFVGSQTEPHDLGKNIACSAFASAGISRSKSPDDVFGPHDDDWNDFHVGCEAREALKSPTPSYQTAEEALQSFVLPRQGLVSVEMPDARLVNIPSESGGKTPRTFRGELHEHYGAKIREKFASDGQNQDIDGRVVSESSGFRSCPSAQLPPPDSQPVTGRDISSVTGYLQHRRGTNLCLPADGHNAKPEPWPQLRRIERPPSRQRSPAPLRAPWSRDTLRKTPGRPGELQTAEEEHSPLVWRQNLRRTRAENRSSSANVDPPEAPAQWRETLMRTKPEAPLPNSDKNDTCSFCDQGPSSPPRDCSHPNNTPRHPCSREVEETRSTTPAATKVRQVERSLAREKVEELEALRKDDVAAPATPEGSKSSDGGSAQHQIVWHDAGGVALPDNHACRWRDLYMNLTGEVEKWKAELDTCDLVEGEQRARPPSRRDIGVGNGASHEETPDDVGIEGLTIVVHMAYRDDLVIHTDLHGERPSNARAQGRRG
ncbi:hypothetical protein HIM_07721 [Hirsutella minnesotensis 3608]|uniref:Uncharacterized protein n=1 Tax=Hirsutella minnesotensis 3608 TaxID=1043627 RepID=A0A0F7ZTE2_9HYPO|nr:hypothetical protein HIM_07721 [Hirsutella minnesotensis 3608]